MPAVSIHPTSYLNTRLQTPETVNNAVSQLTAAITQVIQAQPGQNKDQNKHHGRMKPPEPPRLNKIAPKPFVTFGCPFLGEVGVK